MHIFRRTIDRETLHCFEDAVSQNEGIQVLEV